MEASASSFRAGDVCLTTYGVGVIVAAPSPPITLRRQDGDDTDTDDTGRDTPDVFYSVRLWRVPGKSIGSATLARLLSTAIRQRLPVAPGMMTRLTDGTHILVHCYYRENSTYLVSLVSNSSTSSSNNNNNDSNNDNGNTALDTAATKEWRHVPVDSVQEAPSAKFYPLLEALLVRAEQAATLTHSMLQSESTKRLVDTTGQAIQSGVAHFQNACDDSSCSTTAAATTERTGNNSNSDGVTSLTPRTLVPSLQNLLSSVQQAAPEMEENLKQVLTMVKDEQITVLLEKCQARLEQLVSSDISETTRLALEKTGIRLNLGDNTASAAWTSMDASRQAALSAIRQLLRSVNPHHDGDQDADFDIVDKVRDDLAHNFTVAFDTLSKAAQSDRGLSETFAMFADKTAAWQQATGRLLSTRSANLFLEGASRIQARAAAMFSNSELMVVSEIGSKLTKSFTEGDAALSRLKSIELGEAVKSRLIQAIEIRSESMGGLDGIIAGALSSVQFTGHAGTQIQDMLKHLQNNASSATVDAHETLLAILSSRSSYRDIALLRLEQTLCNLGNQIGDDLSPATIASIVRGEGGTEMLFQPIARRAMEQIQKQLDTAEKQVKDTNVLDVLTRIRRLLSGELTLNAILDEFVNVLNDDSVVSAGEYIVQQSEQVLDAIEGVSASNAVSDAMQMVESAGITKETVMREFEKLNMNNILDVAQQAVSDEKARQELLSSATDTALDFLLRILPSMPVPPFEGVKDGLVYHISNLSMKGFHVKKNDIHIELAGMHATKSKTPLGGTSGIPYRDFTASRSSYTRDETDMPKPTVKATELLIIDVRNISAVLNNAAWSFEQTYLPYLKGGGIANAFMSGGSIRLQFELRKRRKGQPADTNTLEWEPVLCLHDRTCTITEVDLALEGDSRVTWLLNKIATIFKAPLRDFVVSSIVKVLSNRSGWILERLNKILTPYWDLILRTAQLQMDDLVEADEDVILKEENLSDASIVELVWRERLPLGMNLLMNDDSGVLKVVDFPRGSQARVVCEKGGFEPDAFKGASVIAVNGSTFEDQEHLFEALRDPGRPKTVMFRLTDTEDAERLRKLLEGDKSTDHGTQQSREFGFRRVQFNSSGELGIEFGSSYDSSGLVVCGFVEGEGGTILAAERSGLVKDGDLLCHVNDIPVFGVEGNTTSRAINILQSSTNVRPLSLTLTESYMHKVLVQVPGLGRGVDGGGGPMELVIRELHEGDRRRVVVQGFNPVSGMAEAGGILIGDHLVFINGFPVGAGCRWLDTPVPTLDEVFNMLKNETFYPIGLTFARPKQTSSRWILPSQGISDIDVETICITADSFERLGIKLENDNMTDVVISDFQAVPGVFQRSMSRCVDGNGNICLAVDAINGQFVPSYASVEMVRNALNRSWKAGETVELLLCDTEQKAWLISQQTQK